MVTWDKKYEIGHQRIDFEHQIFLGLIVDFKRMAEGGSSLERLHRMLTEILKYAEFHFVSEENIMLDCNYPLHDEHARMHGGLLNRLRLNLADLKLGRISTQAMYEFLFDWFVLHTTHEDIKIAQYLHDKTELKPGHSDDTQR